MMHLFTTLFGFIPAVHAAQQPLNEWVPIGQNNQPPAGVQEMWNIISMAVYLNIPATDVVHALTGGIVHLIFTFIAGVSALLIMYAGIRMIVSRGKEDEFTQGKTIILYALIGLVSALVASSIINFLGAGFLPQFLQ